MDPITGMWEELGKISPYEMVLIQYIMRPIGDEGHWRDKGYKLVKKLKGMPQEEKDDLVVKLLGAIFGPLLDAFIRPTPSETKKRTMEQPPSLMLHLTDAEKKIIDAIEKKMSRLCYQTKIRYLYISPKEKYNPSPVHTAIVGSMKALTSSVLNGLKPDTDHWTKVKYWLFKQWEKPIVDLRLRTRKRRHFNLIKKRFYFHGRPPTILNTEELATIIHFPMITVTVPPIDKVTVTKVQAPPELPIVP